MKLNIRIIIILLFLVPKQAQGVTEKLVIPACIYSSFKLHNPIMWGLTNVLLIYEGIKKIREQRLKSTRQDIIANPATNVFAFDFHDVLVTPDFKEGFKLVTAIPDKTAIVAQVLKPWFVLDFVSLFTTTIFEDVINSIIKEYPALKNARSSLLAIGNAQTPIQGTFDLIHALKLKGYKVFLFSNIGQDMFQEFHAQHMSLFKDFDGFFVSSPETDYVHKPEPEAYNLFLEHFNLKPEQVIFVDNSIKNIVAARKTGIIGILFKSVPQLHHELEAIKALP